MSGAPPLFLSLCNEMLADEGLSLDDQCRVACALGYRGLELAPGTLSAQPHTLPDEELAKVRDTIEWQGLVVTGLHWLLAPYPDASIVDPAAQERTEAILLGLVDQCAALGASVLVHGSPSSRQLPAGMTHDAALDQAARLFKPIARRAEERGVTYCIEPLGRGETDFINTVVEGQALVEMVGSPAFQTMIDTSAAGQAEAEPVADLIERWVPKGNIAHIQVNDTNRGAPGTGDDPFADIVNALKVVGWSKPIAVEPFRAVVNATATAAIGAATMRALWQADQPRKAA